jgi:hypothetical protein
MGLSEALWGQILRTGLWRSPPPERLDSTSLFEIARDMSDAVTCFDIVVFVRCTVGSVSCGLRGRLDLPTAQC